MDLNTVTEQQPTTVKFETSKMYEWFGPLVIWPLLSKEPRHASLMDCVEAADAQPLWCKEAKLKRISRGNTIATLTVTAFSDKNCMDVLIKLEKYLLDVKASRNIRELLVYNGTHYKSIAGDFGVTYTPVRDECTLTVNCYAPLGTGRVLIPGIKRPYADYTQEQVDWILKNAVKYPDTHQGVYVLGKRVIAQVKEKGLIKIGSAGKHRSVFTDLNGVILDPQPENP